MPEDQALDRLQAILARPEYRFDDTTPWWQQLVTPLLESAWSLLGRLIELIVASSTGREGVIGIVVLVLACVCVLAALAYLIRAIRLSVARDSALRSASLAERRERSDQLYQAAQQAAGAGNYAQAVRLLYLSALYALDERELLHVERSLTNREHAERLRLAHPAVADSFADLVDRYERVRYGRAAVAAEAFAEFSGRAQHVRSAVLESAVV
jgi:uncharacterized protein DUF4129